MFNKNPENSSSMDQVRDLLMGTHLKDMETRLQRQEKSLLREIANLRETMQHRVDSLENFMKNEFASFLRRLQEEKSERISVIKGEQRERAESLRIEQKERSRALKEEKNEREESVMRLAKDLSVRDEELERKFDSMTSSLHSAEQGLRDLMLSETARITKTLEEKYQEGMNSLSATATQIRHDVVSRSSLSALFAEAAVRFSEAPSEKNEEISSPVEESPIEEGGNES